jgi:hypothetical protein
MEEFSKLVEVVRPCHGDIVVDLQLSAFRDGRNTKDDNRNVFTETGLPTYSMAYCKKPLGYGASERCTSKLENILWKVVGW